MPITVDHGQAFTFRVTRALLEFFEENRIQTTGQKRNHRWSEGTEITSASDTRFNSYSMLLNGNHVTKIGAFSYSFSTLDPYTEIGRYCSIAVNVRVMGPEHATRYVTSSEILYRVDGLFADTFSDFGNPEWQFLPNPQRGFPKIGSDVWIGQDVLIKGGVSIGTGAVIGAGAVVVKDVAPYEIVGGVPARHIRWRFPKEIVDELLKLQWWDYAVPALPDLPWNEPAKFIEALPEAIKAGTAKRFSSDLGSVRDIVERFG